MVGSLIPSRRALESIPEINSEIVIVLDSILKVPNQDNCYYYVPSILLKGWPECIGKESGTTYYYSEVPETLMVINALDGSIINSTNA